MPDIRRKVRIGYTRMSELDVVVLGLARDCAVRLPATLERVEVLGTKFKSWAAAFVENDSKDKTPRILQKWKDGRENIRIETTQQGMKKWGMVRSGERGKQMAAYRNRCRKLARPLIKQADAVIVLDTDLVDWSLDGIATSFASWGDWDAMASCGVRYQKYRGKRRWVQADAWALRRNGWKARSFHDQATFVPPIGDPLVPVRSAFGGLGIYTAEAYLSAPYGGGDCEHVVLHKNLVKKGFKRFFLNPSQVVYYNTNSGKLRK